MYIKKRKMNPCNLHTLLRPLCTIFIYPINYFSNFYRYKETFLLDKCLQREILKNNGNLGSEAKNIMV